jgi:hypothetical protein
MWQCIDCFAGCSNGCVILCSFCIHLRALVLIAYIFCGITIALVVVVTDRLYWHTTLLPHACTLQGFAPLQPKILAVFLLSNHCTFHQQCCPGCALTRSCCHPCTLQGLAPLQPRILLWLGRQGGPAAAALAAAAANTMTLGAAAAGGGGNAAAAAAGAGVVWCDGPLVGIATLFPAEHSGGQISLEVSVSWLVLHLGRDMCTVATEWVKHECDLLYVATFGCGVQCVWLLCYVQHGLQTPQDLRSNAH